MPREIFRFTSAGAVDDGKSTLLARLLLDTDNIFRDQIPANLDVSRIADLMDGLESEREQGITIDVARRFFDTDSRRYQVADSPGHQQYTRNMATACADSDAVMIVVDAISGPREQTRRHLEISLLLGIRDFIFAVTKLDALNYKQSSYEQVSAELLKIVSELEAQYHGISTTVIPVSGARGDNVVRPSKRTKWYSGPTLLAALEAIPVRTQPEASTSLAVQLIQRLPAGGRRYLGTVLGGELKQGDELWVGSSSARISNLLVHGQKATSAPSGTPVAVELNSEFDIQRGGILASAPLESSTQFDVSLIWLANTSGQTGRRFSFKAGPVTSKAVITQLSNLDRTSSAKVGQSKTIETNEIKRSVLTLAEPLPLQPFEKSARLGRFVMIDPASGETVAVGIVNFALRRATNVKRHDFTMSPEMHSELTGTTGKVIWFTGLPSSGKSTAANAMSMELYRRGTPHFILDGDNLRLGINSDLGFTEADRTENIRRVAEVAKLMADAGLIVLVALVSPLRVDRELAGDIVGQARFREVHVATSLEICQQRDPKGLYKRAKDGKIPNFTGVSAPYEPPENPWVRLEEGDDPVEKLASAL